MLRFLTLLALAVAVAAVPIDDDGVDRSQFNRIVGGSDIAIGQRAFQALVLVGGRLYCGGTIITPVTILTACHCAQLNANQYQVKVGSAQQSSGGTTAGVASLLRHNAYNSNTFDNDIALFYLGSRLTFGPNIAAASLAAPGYNVPDGQNCVVSGWGDLAVSIIKW